MLCCNCGKSFKKIQGDNVSLCSDCLDEQDPFTSDAEEEYEVDILHLRNPSGKTSPVFEKDGYED